MNNVPAAEIWAITRMFYLPVPALRSSVWISAEAYIVAW